jgi:hypothetical protein
VVLHVDEITDNKLLTRINSEAHFEILVAATKNPSILATIIEAIKHKYFD